MKRTIFLFRPKEEIILHDLYQSWKGRIFIPYVWSDLTSLATASPCRDFGNEILHCSFPALVTAFVLPEFSLKCRAAKANLKQKYPSTYILSVLKDKIHQMRIITFSILFTFTIYDNIPYMYVYK